VYVFHGCTCGKDGRDVLDPLLAVAGVWAVAVVKPLFDKGGQKWIEGKRSPLRLVPLLKTLFGRRFFRSPLGRCTDKLAFDKDILQVRHTRRTPCGLVGCTQAIVLLVRAWLTAGTRSIGLQNEAKAKRGGEGVAR